MRLLLRPGWIVTHLAVVVIAVTFVNLGLWQLERHAETRVENERITQAAQSAALPVDQALQQQQLVLQPVTATGTFAQGADVRLSPRSRNQIPGFEVLTPLRLPDGRNLLVNRGWVPLDADIPSPPPGEVALKGRLQLPARARQVLPVDGDTAELVSNPDLELLADQIPDLIDVAYMDAVDEEAREAGVVPRPAEPVALDAGNHLSYAMQWFAFTAIGLIGYPLLLRRRMADAGEADPRSPRQIAGAVPDDDGSDGAAAEVSPRVTQ